MPPQIHTQPKKNRRLRILLSLLLFLIAALGGSAYYFYREAGKLKENTSAPVGSLGDEKIIEEVGQLFILPEGETPTVATVSDPAELAGHPLFSQAKKGDKVLIYRPSGRLVLYRPDTGKIVETGILDAGEPFPEE